VTLQDSCHLSHAQRITEAPRVILRSIPGVEIAEMADSSRCCGAGGTYTITQREFSIRLLDNKMSAVEGTQTDVLATANPGCYLQLQYGVKRAGLNTRTRYITDLLDEAYAAE
jgi:glycolate oxidase iron-sulfur subunit